MNYFLVLSLIGSFHFFSSVFSMKYPLNYPYSLCGEDDACFQGDGRAHDHSHTWYHKFDVTKLKWNNKTKPSIYHVQVKYGGTSILHKATICFFPDDETVTVVLEEPDWGIYKGGLVIFYQENECLGSGEISSLSVFQSGTRWDVEAAWKVKKNNEKP